jgi:hypothetical protein
MKVLPSFEQPIYSDGLYNPYVDEISSRERRSLRQKPKSVRRNDAFKAQGDAGYRVRISRPVLNQPHFMPELKTWIPFVQAGVARRRSLGNLALTVFDTSQQPLMREEGFESEERLKDRLFDRRPELARDSPPIIVKGMALFGNAREPFVGLTLEPGFVYEELGEVRRIVSPALDLDRSHQLDHIPHVTLGQISHLESIDTIQSALREVLPEYVQFAAADVTYKATA